jgi:SOS-response transcriptional repressor LexA
MSTPCSPTRLSPRQVQLVSTITRLTAKLGYPPSYDDLADAMRVHRTRVAQLVKSTEAKGALRRDPGRARSCRVVSPTSAS